MAHQGYRIMEVQLAVPAAHRARAELALRFYPGKRDNGISAASQHVRQARFAGQVRE
jgi:hypothetical protein